MTEEDAKNRIKSQMSLDEKCAKATFVIDNSGSKTATKEQVEKILQTLNDSWLPFTIRAVLITAVIVAALSIGAVIQKSML